MTITVLTAVTGAFAFTPYGASPAHVRFDGLTDQVIATDAVKPTYAVQLFDGVFYGEGGTIPGSVQVAYGLSLTGGVGIAPTQKIDYGVQLLEKIGLSLTDSPNVAYHLTLTDQAVMQAALQVGIPVHLAEAVGIAPTLNVIRNIVLAEKLGLGSLLVPETHYGITVSEQIHLLANLDRFLGASIHDGIGFHDGFIPQWALSGVLNDGIGIHPAQSPVLLFGVELVDGIEMTHTQLLKMIFNGAITDSMVIRSLYVAPNGTYTTWAMNTRTGAVTEYTNYVFNSFAKISVDRYIGASVQPENPGIYILDGERDVTANIIADIKGGRMAPGGSKFSTFRSAYLGINTNDDAADFILKMEAADGREYIYGVKPNAPGTTTKVNMGRGLRSRYFSYELISSGADFDLDTIEFIPLISKRRVD